MSESYLVFCKWQTALAYIKGRHNLVRIRIYCFDSY